VRRRVAGHVGDDLHELTIGLEGVDLDLGGRLNELKSEGEE
jgi:hypothetical protein